MWQKIDLNKIWTILKQKLFFLCILLIAHFKNTCAWLNYHARKQMKKNEKKQMLRRFNEFWIVFFCFLRIVFTFFVLSSNFLDFFEFSSSLYTFECFFVLFYFVAFQCITFCLKAIYSSQCFHVWRQYTALSAFMSGGSIQPSVLLCLGAMHCPQCY